jgi:hypothetical protein
MWQEVADRSSQELAVMLAMGVPETSPKALAKRQDIETAQVHMTELWQAGVIQKVPLKLVGVS